MNPERPENKPALRDLFLRALELQSEPEREAYLQDIRSKHPELYPRLMALLRNEKEDSFLEYPAAEGVGTLAVSAPLSEGPGTIIGKYKLLEPLGEGGFGVVYMAEQKEPVKRRVALKIIKVGMDTREVVARFEAERQALAIMDHPNIAKVHDGGATETGRPYFVMELVRGVEITRYCDEKNLSTRERLDLFTQVCHAVQHAHQKGIIHRDLKPSNILVTVNDGLAVPKVIDFGIAKATQLELTEKTVVTRFHQFIGTPAYLSPEQADISSVDIDTRSDIYSLGVLLYELLTGKTPFDGKELLKIGLDEMRRTIREEEPERPSTRVSTLGADELTTTAKRRGLEPLKLVNLLRGDLDWIVMKCIEKDRARRYETANGVAMDIQRHLNSEPVVACPPSAVYKLRKLVRRNKGVFAAVGTIVTLLVLATGATTWEAVRTRRAEQEQVRLRRQAETNQQNAEASERKAQFEAIKSDQVAQFFGNMLEGVGPSVALGRDTTLLREILDRAIVSFNTELTNNPAAEESLRHSLGKVYRELGLFDRAEEMQRGALSIAERIYGNTDMKTGYMLVDLGWTLVYLVRQEEAEAKAREALAVFKAYPPAERRDNGVYLALGVLANSLRWQGRLNESADAYREALAIARKYLGNNSPVVATELNNLANDVRDLGGPAEAEAMLRESLDIGKRNHMPENNPGLAMTLHNLSVTYMQEGKFVEAADASRRRLALLRNLVGDHPELVPELTSQLMHVYSGLPDLLIRAGRSEEAADMRREAMADLLKKTDALELQTQPQSADFLWVRGQLLARLGRWQQAAADLTRLRDIRPGDGRIWHALAAVLVQKGDFEAFAEHRRRSLEQFASTKDADIAEPIAKDCLILPATGDQLRKAAQMADNAFILAKYIGRQTWYECCKGLAEYREGHFANAAELMQRVLSRSGDPKAPIPLSSGTGDSVTRDVEAWAVLAMAQHQLNHDEAALVSLARGVDLARDKLPKLRSEDLGIEWIDWIIAHALLHEASGLIAPAKNPNPVSN